MSNRSVRSLLNDLKIFYAFSMLRIASRDVLVNHYPILKINFDADFDANSDVNFDVNSIRQYN